MLLLAVAFCGWRRARNLEDSPRSEENLGLEFFGLGLEVSKETGWRGVGFAVGAAYTLEDEVDDSEGKEGNHDTNNAVEDSIAGFGDFAGIALGGDEADATDNHGDNCDNPNKAEDDVDDGTDIPDDVFFRTVGSCFVGREIALGNSFKLGMTRRVAVLIVQTTIWTTNDAFAATVSRHGRSKEDAGETDDGKQRGSN